MTTRNESTPGHLAWQVALGLAAVLGTLATACMMPFVAIAAATAATMPRPRAAATVTAVWGTSQLLGFALLGYPWTGFALAWGAALGGASILAMLVASSVLGGRRASAGLLAAAFAAAFAAYEVGLFAFALVAGGTATFTAPIMLRILANDAGWFAALLVLHVLLTRAAPRTFGPALSMRAA